MRTYKLMVTIPENHRLSLEIPEEVPAGGPVEVLIIVPEPEERKIVRLGGVLGGTEEWQEEEGDPIAEVLDEVRKERQELLDRKHEDLIWGDSD